MKLLITYLKPYKGLVLLALLLAGINQTFSLFDPMIFGKLIDQFANHAKTNADGSFRSESEFIKPTLCPAISMCWRIAHCLRKFCARKERYF